MHYLIEVRAIEPVEGVLEQSYNCSRHDDFVAYFYAITHHCTWRPRTLVVTDEQKVALKAVFAIVKLSPHVFRHEFTLGAQRIVVTAGISEPANTSMSYTVVVYTNTRSRPEQVSTYADHGLFIAGVRHILKHYCRWTPRKGAYVKQGALPAAMHDFACAGQPGMHKLVLGLRTVMLTIEESSS